MIILPSLSIYMPERTLYKWPRKGPKTSCTVQQSFRSPALPTDSFSPRSGLPVVTIVLHRSSPKPHVRLCEFRRFVSHGQAEPAADVMLSLAVEAAQDSKRCNIMPAISEEMHGCSACLSHMSHIPSESLYPCIEGEGNAPRNALSDLHASFGRRP